MSQFQLLIGDCLELLRQMPDNSVDSVVTDPPYGLSFMGKKWDYDVPAVDVWAECLRVLKPGGHLLAFAGTRTQHRMAVRIEDAGFEIRDMIAWVYGSGFPKSMDVSKAIDKAGGNPRAFVEFARAYAAAVAGSSLSHADIDRHLDIKSSSCYWAREDHRGGMPPRHHWEMVRDLLNLSPDLSAAYDEAEREVLATQVRYNEASGIVSAGRNERTLVERKITAPATDAAKQWEGWGTALKPALEPITMARKPLIGTVAANVIAFGTGALNINDCRVEPTGESRPRSGEASQDQRYTENGGTNFAAKPGVRGGDPAGRWPANLVHDGSPEVVALFPNSDSPWIGNNNSGAKGGRMFGGGQQSVSEKPEYRDAGSASRFFYCAKTSKKDRGTDNTHPTVKPTDLMAYLLRLVTPPGGTALDPFMGSGSTGKAAMREGFEFIGCEIDEQYAAIARARIEHEAGLHKSRKSETDQIDLFTTA